MSGRAALKWAGLLAAASLLLSGRFDFHEAGGQYARQGYLSSLYFLWLVIPTSYFLTLELSGRRGLARAACAVTFAVTSLPLHWLRLDRFRRVTTLFDADSVVPRLAWFPQNSQSGAPHERWLLLALVLGFAAVAWLCTRETGRWRRLWPWVALLALLALQTGLHTSMRSPYTYTPHFESPNKWYHGYLLPNGKAAVNADAIFFTSLEDHFNAIPRPIHPLLIRRSFIEYLSAPFSYFWNPYYVYLIFNPLLWLAAVACTYAYALELFGGQLEARLAAALAASGSGFIYYVAQPTSYLAGFAGVIFVFYLYERFLVRKGDPPRVGRALIYGALLGLLAATYDLFPFFAALLVYGWLRRVSVRDTAIAIAFGLAIPAGFVALQFQILHVPRDQTNAVVLWHTGAHLLHHLGHTSLVGAIELGEGLTAGFWQSLVFAFTLVAALLAAAGLFCADRGQRARIGTLLLPAFFTVGYLYLGGAEWGRVALADLPRFSYVAYPAIYLGAALALARLGAALRAPLGRRLAGLIPWAVVGLIFLLHNVDVLGYPALNYHFYWPTGVSCDPYAKPACSDLPSSF